MGHDYYTVHRFMATELGLRGAELQVYALIYSFSKDGAQAYRGSRRYISKTVGVTVKTVERALMSLTRRGFLIREEINCYFAQYSYRINTDVLGTLC